MDNVGPALHRMGKGEVKVAEVISLINMRPGQMGRIVGVLGGHGLIRRLEILGLRAGKQVRKISSQLMRGPIVLEVDNTRLAIGFGMARRIMVEVE